MGGLDSVLELAPRARVVVHEGFSKHLIHDLRGQCGGLTVVGPERVELVPGVWSTGLLDSDPPEHAMVIDTDDVTAAVTGCAHPGIGPIVQHARQATGKRIHWAIGGFHLMYAGLGEIHATIETLQHLGVERVVPTHCTGDQARAAFRQAYGPACIDGGVGIALTITPP
jgi:7,8-dihydropterin-6-yl-methyl-4-(beta-D-ribofuranosyl)aminobenzene 5'-phosphate synthase